MCDSCGCVSCEACGAPVEEGLCACCGQKPSDCVCEPVDEVLDYEEDEDLDDEDQDEEEDEDEDEEEEEDEDYDDDDYDDDDDDDEEEDNW